MTLLDREIMLYNKAWINSPKLGIYSLVAESFWENTKYSKRVSPSNHEAMYSSCTYRGKERCPYLPMDSVRILGVLPRSGGQQAYGQNYVRIGIDEAVLKDVCSKAGIVLNLKDLPTEKIVMQQGPCLFTEICLRFKARMATTRSSYNLLLSPCNTSWQELT